jgi:protease YdgD
VSELRTTFEFEITIDLSHVLQLEPVPANAMIKTNYDQHTVRTSFAHSAILASVLILLLPGFIASALVTDQSGAESHRELVDINTYPWSSIGKVGIPGFRAVNTCTGAVIGPNQFLTAGHCLYNARTERFVTAGSIHFLLGLVRDEFHAHRVGSRYIVPPTFVPAKVDAFGEDWAVVETDEAFPADIRPLLLATVIPSPGTAVKTGGYDFPRVRVMTADKHCRIIAISVDKKRISNDCAIYPGDSGGPPLGANEGEEDLIWGVNSLRLRENAEIEKLPKESGVAVAAASISDFLATHAAGSVERR